MCRTVQFGVGVRSCTLAITSLAHSPTKKVTTNKPTFFGYDLVELPHVNPGLSAKGSVLSSSAINFTSLLPIQEVRVVFIPIELSTKR